MNYDVATVYASMRSMGTSEAEKLGWTSTDLQRQNYGLVVSMLRDVSVVLPGLTLHDAGCGTGDLLSFLKEVKLEPRQYIGTDFTAESIMLARDKHPSHDFRQMDLLRPVTCPTTDVTIIMGALAYHKPRDVEKLLNKLWDHSRCAFAFNTWWQLDSRYFYNESIEQLRKCVRRFLRGKQVHELMGSEYGQPTEAIFVVYR